MNNRENNSRRLNKSLTQRVIELHALGYDNDYLILDQHLFCVQNNHGFPLNTAHIKVVDQGYDQLSKSFKYIHTIEVCNGEKGVMVMETIFTNSTI